MKKSVLIKNAVFCLILLVLTNCVAQSSARFFFVKSVKAEEKTQYLRVIASDVPFYAYKADDSPLFYLPYTYYVRVIENGERLTHVEFGNDGYTIDGYVPNDKLYYDGLQVNNPFPYTEVFTAQTATLYKDAALTVPVQYLFEARQLYLYGGYVSTQNQPVYYVCYNNKLGYVKEDDITPFVIPNHPNELTFLTPESGGESEPQAPETAAENSDLTLRVAIIAVLALAGFFALFAAVGKKSKVSAAASYYDENDYE